MIKTIGDTTIRQWSSKFRGWHYHRDFVIDRGFQPEAPMVSVDCPMVFRRPGDPQWYMFYTGYEGTGYQTFLASSRDLVQWQPEGCVMSYGDPGTFDFGGVTFGGALYEDYDLKGSRMLKPKDGLFQVLYGCYPHQGGYELRPGAQGRAVSRDGLTWQRDGGGAVLSVAGAAPWEQDCIYQPWLLEHQHKYYNFYNAACGITEQTGLAMSENLRDWQRSGTAPVLKTGESGEFDSVFCSDGKVFYDEDHWVMLYFGVRIDGEVWSAHIMAAYSTDLMHWTRDPEPLYRAGGHPRGLDRDFAHKISLAYDDRREMFFMYYTAVGVSGRGIALLTSKPLNSLDSERPAGL